LLIFHILTGLALVSFSILGAAFFKRTVLSGISVTLVYFILAVVAQFKQDLGTTEMSLLTLPFTPVAYVSFIIGMAQFESKNEGTSLKRSIPDTAYHITGAMFWVFIIIQSVLYPIIAILLERWLYGTVLPTRTITDGNSKNETVKLKNFTKEYTPNWFKRKLLRPFGRRYETVVAVSGLSLTAYKGQIVALLGRNGSGKSTTLDTISGLNQATSGSVELDGSGGVGICPQKNILWDDLTVIEHIRLFSGLKAPNITISEEEIKELIKSIDLEHKANARAKTLSGGQKRKLQLGLMLSGGSKLCCVDEVSSGVGKYFFELVD
jgi:ATP-binding cassette, subfamily A (ABC1), member 3